MGDKSKIEWTDASWNPVRGCSLVSAGCTNCYAMRQAHRLKPYHGLTRMTEHGPVWTGEVRLVPELLDQPLRWRRPRRIFVNSMSDLFYEKVPDNFIDQIFAVMALADWHTYQVLTKRPERMRDYLNDQHRGAKIETAMQFPDFMPPGRSYRRAIETWPLPNVWLGVSCEDQKTADERIPLLLQTPAAVRWISAEPLLEPIDFSAYFVPKKIRDGYREVLNRYPTDESKIPAHLKLRPSIDWVVVGGESGPHARPMHPDWARSIRDQCVAAGVPFFFKQWGEWVGFDDSCGAYLKNPKIPVHSWSDGRCSYRIGKKAAGRLLDGREWNEYPK